jgi:hypothetical protein
MRLPASDHSQAIQHAEWLINDAMSVLTVSSRRRCHERQHGAPSRRPSRCNGKRDAGCNSAGSGRPSSGSCRGMSGEGGASGTSFAWLCTKQFRRRDEDAQ